MIFEIDIDIDNILIQLNDWDREKLTEKLCEELGLAKTHTDNIRQLVYLAQIECLNRKLPHYLRELLYQTTGAEFGI